MTSAGLIEELLSEQTRVIAELDQLNDRIEQVLKAISPPPAQEDIENEPAITDIASAPPTRRSDQRRAA